MKFVRCLVPALGCSLILTGCSRVEEGSFLAAAPLAAVEEVTGTVPASTPIPARRVAASSRIAAPVAAQPVVEGEDVDSQYARSIEQMNAAQARWDREARQAIRSICGNC